MSRPGQRFVPVRSIDNQAELMRHRARELLAGQRTAALNALRGHLAEIGVVGPQGAQHAYDLMIGYEDVSVLTLTSEAARWPAGPPDRQVDRDA
jgi:transposase